MDYPKFYDGALEGCRDRDKILNVFETYPDDDGCDGRKSHNLSSWDAKLYESLQRPVEDCPPEALRGGLLFIGRLIMAMAKDQKGLEIVLCAAAGNSLAQTSALTGIPRDTVRTRLEKVRRDHPEIGGALFPRKKPSTTKFPGGIRL